MNEYVMIINTTVWSSRLAVVCGPGCNKVAYLLAEVLRGDAEDVQAHGGLLELGLQDLQLEVLLLTALPQLLDQGPVQLLGPLSLVGRPSAHCTTESGSLGIIRRAGLLLSKDMPRITARLGTADVYFRPAINPITSW